MYGHCMPIITTRLETPDHAPVLAEHVGVSRMLPCAGARCPLVVQARYDGLSFPSAPMVSSLRPYCGGRLTERRNAMHHQFCQGTLRLLGVVFAVTMLVVPSAFGQ